jgi:hypothetical protein
MERLDDDGGDVTAMGRKDRRGRAQVVVRRDQHVVDGPGRDTRRRGLALREREQTAREQADRTDLVGAVVGALEFQHARSPGVRPREPDGVGRGLGARGAEAQALGARNRARQLLGELERGVGEVGEVRAEGHAAPDRLDDRRMGMAEDHRPPAHREVDERAPVGVPDGGALAAREHHAELARQVVLAGRAGRKEVPRAIRGRRH